MEDTSIKVSTGFTLASKNCDFETEPSIRIYKSSPGTVSLQIRGTRTHTPAIATAYCRKDELIQLRDWINGQLGEGI